AKAASWARIRAALSLGGAEGLGWSSRRAVLGRVRARHIMVAAITIPIAGLARKEAGVRFIASCNWSLTRWRGHLNSLRRQPWSAAAPPPATVRSHSAASSVAWLRHGDRGTH